MKISPRAIEAKNKADRKRENESVPEISKTHQLGSVEQAQREAAVDKISSKLPTCDKSNASNPFPNLKLEIHRDDKREEARDSTCDADTESETDGYAYSYQRGIEASEYVPYSHDAPEVRSHEQTYEEYMREHFPEYEYDSYDDVYDELNEPIEAPAFEIPQMAQPAVDIPAVPVYPDYTNDDGFSQWDDYAQSNEEFAQSLDRINNGVCSINDIGVGSSGFGSTHVPYLVDGGLCEYPKKSEQGAINEMVWSFLDDDKDEDLTPHLEQLEEFTAQDIAVDGCVLESDFDLIGVDSVLGTEKEENAQDEDSDGDGDDVDEFFYDVDEYEDSNECEYEVYEDFDDAIGDDEPEEVPVAREDVREMHEMKPEAAAVPPVPKLKIQPMKRGDTESVSEKAPANDGYVPASQAVPRIEVERSSVVMQPVEESDAEQHIAENFVKELYLDGTNTKANTVIENVLTFAVIFACVLMPFVIVQIFVPSLLSNMVTNGMSWVLIPYVIVMMFVGIRVSAFFGSTLWDKISRIWKK